MAVLIDNMHSHVKLYTSSTQVCLLYFNVPLVLTTQPFLVEMSQPSCGDTFYICKADGKAVVIENSALYLYHWSWLHHFVA